MLPARFEYHRPSTLDEALEALSSHGEDAKVLAGGQSLIPLMRFRLASPRHVIDISRIPDLDVVAEGEGTLRVGALVKHSFLAASDIVRSRYPAMATAAPLISDPVVRNLGTIGGSLAHADPAGDWGSVMLAMGSTVIARTTRGEREIPIGELLQELFTTTLEPDEILTEVRIPTPPVRSGGTYLKLERKVGDFATVGVAAQLSLDDGHVARAGIGLTAVGLRNIRAEEAETHLAGVEPTQEAFAEAGRLAAQAAQPVADVRGSAEYKRHMVEVFVRRGLARALELAGAA